MNVSYTMNQIGRAAKDVEDVYNLAEKRLGAGCLKWNRDELENAFQVFRYAFQEWASSKEVGVVLRALMYREFRSQEVRRILGSEEMGIFCEDEETAEAVEKLLRKDGYKEEDN